MSITSEQEHQFGRAKISRLRERYLTTNVMAKIRDDPGYAEKVALIEKALAGTKDWILDVGANTCGESEYLTTRDYKIIANDINEMALEVSRERCARFGRPSPDYLAGDAQNLQLEDECVSFVIFNESLHHMPDAAKALAQAARVLKPGGRVFLYEPYAYNPYRRLSEVRDYFRGTVEKSFGIGQLRGLLTAAGLEVVSLQRHVCAASEWKLSEFNPVHRVLRKLYILVSKRMLWLFGNLMVVAKKPAARPVDWTKQCAAPVDVTSPARRTHNVSSRGISS
jgi:ubiquinone/menaquinone biosynthesis C-methylase UbiE